MGARKLFTFERRYGEPVIHGAVKVIPVTRVLLILLPGTAGGLVWNMPAGVRIVAADGTERYEPVLDVTRMGQVGVLAAGILGGLLLGLMIRMVQYLGKRKQNLKFD